MSLQCAVLPFLTDNPKCRVGGRFIRSFLSHSQLRFQAIGQGSQESCSSSPRVLILHLLRVKESLARVLPSPRLPELSLSTPSIMPTQIIRADEIFTSAVFAGDVRKVEDLLRHGTGSVRRGGTGEAGMNAHLVLSRIHIACCWNPLSQKGFVLPHRSLAAAESTAQRRCTGQRQTTAPRWSAPPFKSCNMLGSLVCCGVLSGWPC